MRALSSAMCPELVEGPTGCTKKSASVGNSTVIRQIWSRKVRIGRNLTGVDERESLGEQGLADVLPLNDA
jgi:hypothetical protein